MKVLIKKTNEIKEVNDSYAVNYLIPKGLAVMATESVLSDLAQKDEARQKTYQEKQEELKILAKSLNGKKVTIKEKANAEGELFGSIQKQQVKKALNIKEKITVILPEPIKHVGTFPIELKVGKQSARIVLNIEKI
jgi:large subunit ribosomal protein L9